jgi:hypothetical protein
MAQSEQTTQEKKFIDRIWSLGFGLLMLLISILLTYGAFFEKRTEQNIDIPILNLIFALVITWSFTICCFCTFFKHPFVVRMYQLSGVLGTVTLMILLLFMSSKELLTRTGQHLTSFDGTETFFVLLTALNVIGLIIFFLSKYKCNKQTENINSQSIASSPLIIVVWPIIIFARSLFGLFWLLCVVALTFLGNWIGSKNAYPLLGTVCGFALLPILGAILLAFVTKMEQLKRNSQINNKDIEGPSRKTQT